MTDAEWLLIAEFARRCRLPVSTLRYYDRVGLLLPASVDPHTGYRRYHPGQLPTAITIAGLRAIGTNPDMIARILDGGGPAEVALAAERRRLSEEITERRQALARLDEFTDHAPAGVGVGVPCEIELPTTSVVALRFTADVHDLSSTITRSIATLRARLRRHQLLRTEPRWGALLPLDLDTHVTGHVFARTSALASGLATVLLPHGPAFEISHQGGYGHLAQTYDRALAEIDRNALQPTTPVIEDYPPATDPGEGPSVRISLPVIGRANIRDGGRGQTP